MSTEPCTKEQVANGEYVLGRTLWTQAPTLQTLCREGPAIGIRNQHSALTRTPGRVHGGIIRGTTWGGGGCSCSVGVWFGPGQTAVKLGPNTAPVRLVSSFGGPQVPTCHCKGRLVNTTHGHKELPCSAMIPFPVLLAARVVLVLGIPRGRAPAVYLRNCWFSP